MPTAEKERAIQRAKEWYDKSLGLVFADYRGLKVKEIQQLRAQLKAKGGELHVVKNTLFRRAASDVIERFPEDLHNGPTAIAFVFENETECAKVLWDYSIANKSLKVKGGYFNGQVFDAKGVERLSKLPSREVLLAQVIGAIAAPLSNLVGVIDALYAQPIRTIYAAADKLGAAPAEQAADASAAAEAESPLEAQVPAESAHETSETADTPATEETPNPEE